VPIAGELRESVAALLGIEPGEVGIKAKTPEGLNQDHVAVAHVTVLLESLALSEPVGVMTAAAEAGDEIDVVVKTLIGNARDVSALGRKVTPFDTDDLT
jgi:2-C-methyl-D-erythritol 2,4-cyclodiphosphate synthase